MWSLASPGLQLDDEPAVGGETGSMAVVVDNPAATVAGREASLSDAELWSSVGSDIGPETGGGGSGGGGTRGGSKATNEPSAVGLALVGPALALAIVLVSSTTAIGAVGLINGKAAVGVIGVGCLVMDAVVIGAAPVSDSEVGPAGLGLVMGTSVVVGRAGSRVAGDAPTGNVMSRAAIRNRYRL